MPFTAFTYTKNIEKDKTAPHKWPSILVQSQYTILHSHESLLDFKEIVTTSVHDSKKFVLVVSRGYQAKSLPIKF